MGALLLARDGHLLDPVVLSPLEAPGRRRLRQLVRPELILDARDRPPDFEARVTRALEHSRPDLLVSWFWTRKLPAAWLEAARLGAIGAHPSLLPRHRGPNPYFWTIDSGDELAGVTVHRLGADYDTGAILAARALPVENRNTWQLARALDRPSLELLRETAARIASDGGVHEVPQDEALTTWAPEPTGDELRVDFGWTTERVLRRIRALSPTPGLALEVLDVDLFVTSAEPADTYVQALFPGEAQVSDALSLRTQDGAVRVTAALFPTAPGSGARKSQSEDVLARTGAEVVALLKRAGRP